MSLAWEWSIWYRYIWDDVSGIFNKKVRICVCILWVNLDQSSPFRVLFGDKSAGLETVLYPQKRLEVLGGESEYFEYFARFPKKEVGRELSNILDLMQLISFFLRCLFIK